jgi:predicted NAD/FAD-binding protein
VEQDADSRKIAVVGGGVAGIAAAYVLARTQRVTLFEQAQYLGGHTNTITIRDGPDAGVAVDTGFIVCNPENYPNFYRFLDQLGIARRDSEMSFGFQCEKSGLCYVGPHLRSFLAAPRNLCNPAFLRLLWDQRRFNRCALRDLASGTLENIVLGEYFERLKLSSFFIDNYMVPLAAAIWSSPDVGIYKFPASTFIRFFNNHGMLDFSRLPHWQTVVGGSHSYVRAFQKSFQGTLRLGCKVQAVMRNGNTVQVVLADGEVQKFDAVVLAAHADQTLKLLSDPSAEEKRLLGAWAYQQNHTVLHTDTSFLPSTRRMWASWNYMRSAQARGAEPLSITYYMNRLQGLRVHYDYLVSLNAAARIDPSKIIYETMYSHPVYTDEAVHSQPGLRALNGARRTYYCGSYMGYGFHEDALSAGLEAAAHLGGKL